MAFIGHRRFLGRNHPYRKQKAAFNNFPEHSPHPVPLTGEEVLCRVEEEVLNWLFGKKYPQPPYKGAEDETRPCWKKKSIFFKLDYWKFLPVRHCLDVMHIGKDVCDSLIGTLLNIPGKTKDGAKTRLDLVELGIRLELQPNFEGPKKQCLPLVPEDYSSNISNLVSMDDLRLSGLKSHDSHALMQQLLPIAIRGVLEKPVRIAVIRLCLFFNEICCKTIDVSRLPKIQSDLVETLCELEKYFPPSFFDIMVHLTVHLVREVELCGPVFFRWMYPFERYMKVCKGYVRNRNRPEGCIAECYTAEEAVEFIAKTFFNDNTVGIPAAPNREDKPTSGATVVSVYGKLFDQAYLCLLQNTDEIRSYFSLKNEFPRFENNKKWLTDKQNKTFADWLKEMVAGQLSEPGCDIPEIVRWLGNKPSNEVPKFSGYKIRGVQDKRLVTDDMSFYGVMNEIWELEYENFRFPIFKCDWVENGRGVQVDDFGFTLVNLNRKGHLNNTSILGRCVEQIFYVEDPVDPLWSVVIRIPTRDYHDFETDDEIGNILINHHPAAAAMSSIEFSGHLADEEEMGYLRVGKEDIVVDG
ncbi:uncharacterized protein LOC133723223 [Rosa rugosa]|uniref:uncharacterized protein LOC133723223 n=1 Tax=Rosa rugosa TaxID=74645 RepID=UPI002B40DB93|nr:uncharacterized protein LOC133723223 [Rosa rugosa]